MSANSYKDAAPNLKLSPQIQAFYKTHSLSTQVLPASLTSIQECMALAGAAHITISPPLLKLLAKTPATNVATEFPSLFDDEAIVSTKVAKSLWLEDEAGYRLAVTLSDSGKQEVKLTQAINIFCEMQTKLEKLMEEVLQSGHV